MKSKKDYILFLNNKYSRTDNNFYLKRLRGKVTIAVDGGIRFFLKNKIKPDIFIGDFDSSPRLPKGFLKSTETIGHPAAKDKTDSHLAIDLALKRGALKIEICGGLSVSEIDHTLGNIFLLEIINKFQKKAGYLILGALIDPHKRIIQLENESITLKGKPGGLLSVIPLGAKNRLKYKGLLFPAPLRNVSFGDSVPLRNRFDGPTAEVSVEGKVLVVNYSSD